MCKIGSREEFELEYCKDINKVKTVDYSFKRTPILLSMTMGNIENSELYEVGIGGYSSIHNNGKEILTHGLATRSSASLTDEDQSFYLSHNWVAHQDFVQTTERIPQDVNRV